MPVYISNCSSRTLIFSWRGRWWINKSKLQPTHNISSGLCSNSLRTLCGQVSFIDRSSQSFLFFQLQDWRRWPLVSCLALAIITIAKVYWVLRMCWGALPYIVLWRLRILFPFPRQKKLSFSVSWGHRVGKWWILYLNPMGLVSGPTFLPVLPFLEFCGFS